LQEVFCKWASLQIEAAPDGFGKCAIEFWPAQRSKFADQLPCALALQLGFLSDMSFSRFCFMGSSQERPCDDMGGLNLSLGKPDGDAADFLH
jgi:hypothetical protein